MLPDMVIPRRYAHICRVTEMMEQLADRFGLNIDKARLVGLAHDMDREMPSWKALALVADWRIPVSALERINPVLLHGPITAARLEYRYGVLDRSIVTSIRSHTLGTPDFEPLGLALYVADSCEPGRTFPKEEQRRHILQCSTLQEMVREIITLNIRRFGPLEEPTMQLYARVSGE